MPCARGVRKRSGRSGCPKAWLFDPRRRSRSACRQARMRSSSPAIRRDRAWPPCTGRHVPDNDHARSARDIPVANRQQPPVVTERDHLSLNRRGLTDVGGSGPGVAAGDRIPDAKHAVCAQRGQHLAVRRISQAPNHSAMAPSAQLLDTGRDFPNVDHSIPASRGQPGAIRGKCTLINSAWNGLCEQDRGFVLRGLRRGRDRLELTAGCDVPDAGGGIPRSRNDPLRHRA